MTRADRKEQIVIAALELFQSRGFAQVSTRDLAAYAGLSRSHVYHYFKDWSELRCAAFVRFADEQLREVAAPLIDLDPPRALEHFLQDCLPLSSESGWALWLDAWDEAMHDPDMAKVHLQINAQWEGMLADVIAKGVSSGDFTCRGPARVARQLLAMCMGYADDLLLHPTPDARASALDEIMEVARALLMREQTVEATNPT